MSEWLKPSVQMPHENGHVLIARLCRLEPPDYYADIGIFQDGQFYDISEGFMDETTPDLWMPIPEFPAIEDAA